MQPTKFAAALCGTLSAATTLLFAVSAQAQQVPQEAPAPPPAPSAVSPSASPTAIVIREEPLHLFRSSYRSPGLAAALALTPLPVDFGNLYAENVGWAMAYTAGELALMTGMMWLGSSHMCHGSDRCGDWSNAETGGMIALATAYVGVKIVSGIHAASAARDFNEASRGRLVPLVAPTNGGAFIGIAAVF
jgi:hypothetical protein